MTVFKLSNTSDGSNMYGGRQVHGCGQYEQQCNRTATEQPTQRIAIQYVHITVGRNLQ